MNPSRPTGAQHRPRDSDHLRAFFESHLERNAGLPAERRIEFRIGIHLGDVSKRATAI
jgi:class 3 adenylate cyclase